MDEEEEKFEFDEEDFLPAKIDNISVSNLGFIVFLRADGDERVLPIFIGANEAHSIAIAFNNQVPPRPLTHDLLKNMLGLLDCEVTKVQVTSLSENTFFGRVYLKKEGIEEMDIDARPSDAIALALRYQAPIFVHKDVYEAAAIQVKENAGEEGAAVAEAAAGAGTETTAGAGAGEAAAGGTVAEPVRKKPANPVEKLKDALERALSEERYEEAAKIRDELKRLESGN